MGYFANSTEHLLYEEEYCVHCVYHKPDEGGCAIMQMHFDLNYEHCNDPKSPLHMLIPRDGVDNLECKMFYDASPGRCKRTPDLFEVGDAVHGS